MEELNPQVKCPECDGSGELPAPWSLEGPDREGCHLCGGEGIIPKVKLEINKDYVFKSTFTDEEFTASYRGESTDGNVVVWNGKSQIIIPSKWAVREAITVNVQTKITEPDTFDMAQEERLWPSVEFDDITY